MREVVQTPFEPIGHEPVAVRAGDLLWISGQYAGTDDSVSRITGDIREQLGVIFERLRQISSAVGTDFSQTARIRAFVVDPAEATFLAEALREPFLTQPPTVITTGSGGDLVPGARVAVDAMVHISSH